MEKEFNHQLAWFYTKSNKTGFFVPFCGSPVSNGKGEFIPLKTEEPIL